MSTDAQTDLPTPAAPIAGSAQGQPAAPATPGAVTLPVSGKKIKLRRLNGLDSSLAEQLMPEAGFRHLEGAGQSTMYRCMAAYSIFEVDGVMQKPPPTGDALKMLLSSYEEEDWLAITMAWMDLNGGPAFRQGS